MGVVGDLKRRTSAKGIGLDMIRIYLSVMFAASCVFAGEARDNLWVGVSEDGRELKTQETNITLTFIEGGVFMMGSSAGHDTFGPVTKVQISSFWIGKTEITQAQWAIVMRRNESKSKGEELPVTNISHREASEFCAELTRREHLSERLPRRYSYTLPTEAEWEFACRAGFEGEHFPNLEAVGWYLANSGGRVHPVAKKRPNAWGIYDMNGNVSEMCSDLWSNNLARIP